MTRCLVRLTAPAGEGAHTLRARSSPEEALTVSTNQRSPCSEAGRNVWPPPLGVFQSLREVRLRNIYYL